MTNSHDRELVQPIVSQITYNEILAGDRATTLDWAGQVLTRHYAVNPNGASKIAGRLYNNYELRASEWVGDLATPIDQPLSASSSQKVNTVESSIWRSLRADDVYGIAHMEQLIREKNKNIREVGNRALDISAPIGRIIELNNRQNARSDSWARDAYAVGQLLGVNAESVIVQPYNSDSTGVGLRSAELNNLGIPEGVSLMKHLRAELGLTQTQLAELHAESVGRKPFTISYLSRIEAGTRKLSGLQVVQFVELFSKLRRELPRYGEEDPKFFVEQAKRIMYEEQTGKRTITPKAKTGDTTA